MSESILTQEETLIQLQRTNWALQLALRSTEDDLHQTKCKLLEYQLEERRQEKRTSSLITSRATTPRVLSGKSSRSASQQPAAAVSEESTSKLPPFQLEPHMNAIAVPSVARVPLLERQLLQARSELEEWRSTGQIVVASLLLRVQLMHAAESAFADLTSSAYSEALWLCRRNEQLPVVVPVDGGCQHQRIAELEREVHELSAELNRSRVEQAVAQTQVAALRRELLDERTLRSNDVRHMRVQYEEANACRSALLEELERLREEIARIKKPAMVSNAHNLTDGNRMNLRRLAAAQPQQPKRPFFESP